MKLTDDQCAEIRGRLAEADAAKHRKRAERLRRKEAGEVRVEVWLSGRDADDIRQMAKDADVTTSVVITQLLRYYNS
jgi:hypothetical protein